MEFIYLIAYLFTSILFIFLSLEHFCGMFNIIRNRIIVEATIVRRRKYIFSKTPNVEYEYEYTYNNKKYIYTATYYTLIPMYKKSRGVGTKHNIFINKYYDDYIKLKGGKCNLSFWKSSIMGSKQCMVSWIDGIKSSLFFAIAVTMSFMMIKAVVLSVILLF